MNTTRRIALPLAMLSAVTAPSVAQDLTADVVRNADDTVTYTIDLEGPPRGRAFVLTGVTPALPFQSTPFGPLVIDPTGALLVGLVPLDGIGRGRLSLDVPRPAVEGTTLWFQSVHIDIADTWRLSQTYATCLTRDFGFSSTALPPNFAMAVRGWAGTADLEVNYRLVGRQGDRYDVVVTDPAGSEVARRGVRIPAGGVARTGFDRSAGVRRGHQWRIERAGGGVVGAGRFD